jgi:hypothetical protein
MRDVTGSTKRRFVENDDPAIRAVFSGFSPRRR